VDADDTLREALWGDEPAAMRRAIDAGFEPRTPGLQPIREALCAGNGDALRVLVEHGCRLKDEMREWGDPPLHDAVEYGRAELLRLLIADPDFKSEINNCNRVEAYHLSALGIAAKVGDDAVAGASVRCLPSWFVNMRGSHRRRRGRCARCNYELRTPTGDLPVCPECGTQSMG
jgi:hypothetical protein